eukprot:1157797-Pelagomonas_calceolata.AAC.2
MFVREQISLVKGRSRCTCASGKLVHEVIKDGWSVCVVYCLDAHFITDVAKFIAGAMQALSAMVKLELPHVNVLTKMDICESKGKNKGQELLFCSLSEKDKKRKPCLIGFGWTGVCKDMQDTLSLPLALLQA